MVPSDLVSLPPVVLLVGATGTGKTGFALNWAQRFPLEIVNLDASQFYLGMDIGTAKPEAAEQALVPHHLFDIANPDEPLDAGQYLALADEVAKTVSGRGKVPLFVGGTGLYSRALRNGLAEIPAIPKSVRTQLMTELEKRGVHALHAELVTVDPDAAARLSPNDPQRITRALEVYRHTGTTISYFQQAHRFARPRYNALVLGLDMAIDILRPRVEARVLQMFQSGFIAEAQRLLEAGYSPDLRTFKALGYRDVFAHLAGELSLDETRERLVRHHLRYAKRQRTWFSRDDSIHWFTHETADSANQLLARFLGLQDR
jgi:tRNA dimethylallyltransferase